MSIYKSVTVAVAGCFFLLAATITFAKNQSCVEFFASNNTNEIKIQAAYNRLTGKEQLDLQTSMINTLQKNHIEQGKFEDILGTYRMSADNTVLFFTSPYQILSDEKIFSIAKDLAVSLNQESVAVLIPDQSGIGDITVHFTSHKPSINETISMLRSKLPVSYNQAFSLHLDYTYDGFNKAKVTEIEWIGGQLDIAEIKKIFPLEKIDYQYGKAFLIYKNGDKKQL